MKKLLFILFILSDLLFAKSVDTLKNYNTWSPKLILGLNLSQIAFSNWVKGGDNSVTWTLTSNFDLKYKTKTWTLKNDFNIAYGRSKVGKSTYKTNNNEINLESVLSYNTDWVVDPFFGNLIRTQVAAGYDYDVTPAKKIVDFFDPGYITQSFGFEYDKFSLGSTRFGLAFQEIFSNNYIQYTDNEKTSATERFKFETGIESVTKTEFLIDTNVKLKSNLRLFTRFESLDVWDVSFNNKFVSKINSYLQVNLDVLVIYEKAQSPFTQMKEAFQLGVVYNLI